MGSTVTTGRMAAAFRAKSGTVIYCLYEQTYEKNCYPHIPHWSVIYIGEARGRVLQSLQLRIGVRRRHAAKSVRLDDAPRATSEAGCPNCSPRSE